MYTKEDPQEKPEKTEQIELQERCLELFNQLNTLNLYTKHDYSKDIREFSESVDQLIVFIESFSDLNRQEIEDFLNKLIVNADNQLIKVMLEIKKARLISTLLELPHYQRVTRKIRSSFYEYAIPNFEFVSQANTFREYLIEVITKFNELAEEYFQSLPHQEKERVANLGNLHNAQFAAADQVDNSVMIFLTTGYGTFIDILKAVIHEACKESLGTEGIDLKAIKSLVKTSFYASLQNPHLLYALTHLNISDFLGKIEKVMFIERELEVDAPRVFGSDFATWFNENKEVHFRSLEKGACHAFQSFVTGGDKSHTFIHAFLDHFLDKMPSQALLDFIKNMEP